MTAQEAYRKARKLKKRLPELEPIIIQDAHCAVCYAFYVIKGRWIEAEENISNSSYKDGYMSTFFIEPMVTREEIGDLLWDRKNTQNGMHFVPKRLFEASLLDMMVY